MSRLTVSILCRNEGALHLAHSSFNKALGLTSLWNPIASTANQTVLSSALSLGSGGTILELISSPAFSNTRWGKKEQVRLLSIDLGGNGEKGSRALDHALSIAAKERSGRLTAASFLSSIGLSSFAPQMPPGPFVLAPSSETKESLLEKESVEIENVQNEDNNDENSTISISEVVLGAHSSLLYDNACSALETVGATQDPTSLSVWRLPSDRKYAPAIRLIPGNHSALALSCGNYLPRLRERLQDHIAELSQTEQSFRNYGERHSETGSVRQIAVRGIPALQGLDIRLMEGYAPGNVRSFWIESEQCYDDDVDPALNPPGSHISKQQSLSCASVVGMEVMSTVRTRLGLRRI
jgi:hypothetical protein